jgi:hypothetical protein
MNFEDTDSMPFINVNERLPNKKGWYLCRLSDGEEVWLWYDLVEFQLLKMFTSAISIYWKKRTDKRKELK